jgi:Domain of unknown function (DUF4893)
MRAIHPFAVLILVLGLSAPAWAQDWRTEISDFDRGRLDQLSESKAKGLAEAEQGAPAGDLEIIHALVDADGAGVSDNEILGGWQCRTIKLGGMAPDVIYSWFRCRVRNTRNGLYFEKVTGTQRISGYLDEYNDGYLLLGSWTVGHERPKPYSGGNAGAGAPTTHTDAVGVLTALDARHLRIEFPYPFYESTFDVMELKR